MNLKVTSRGVTVPRRLLGTAKAVEVRREDDRIVLVPVPEEAGPSAAHDPIWDLGKDPIDFGITDASVNLDRYLNEELTNDHRP